MAVPVQARTAYKVESELQSNMFSTLESEERMNLLEGMHKLGLSTREVVSFMEKQTRQNWNNINARKTEG